MKFVFLTLGSRGDVQPLIPLGVELQNAGHKVVIATQIPFKDWIEKYGIGFHQLPGNAQELLHSKEGQTLLASGQGLKFVKLLQGAFPPYFKEAEAACQGADVIISVTLTVFIAYTLAEKLKAKFVRMCLVPLQQTNKNPAVILPFYDLKLGLLNYISHELMESLFWGRQKAQVNEWRKSLGLLPVTNPFGLTPISLMQRTPLLAAISPNVFPKPVDWGPDDQTLMSGFIFWPDSMTDKVQIPAGLPEFLDRGDPPVYFGFGSMPALEPKKLLDIVRSVVASTGCRAVLCAGWTNLSSIEDEDDTEESDEKSEWRTKIFRCTSVPHNWLFSKCESIVYHGGVGTTAAALKSGVPSIICSTFGDQPFWGRRIHQLGVGPTHIPFSKLTAQNLTERVLYARQASVRAAARLLGDKMQKEGNGVRAAAQFLLDKADQAELLRSDMAAVSGWKVLAWKARNQAGSIVEALVVISLLFALLRATSWFLFSN